MNASRNTKDSDARTGLLVWYDAQKRDLPWRHTDDPYAIWVSEIMLQQTRVETVLPYFAMFLDRYPTVESLAQAEVEEVLGLWSGLGYYRRARLLHSAARQLTDDGNSLPREIKCLRELPGIGAYTAAAIGSMAFGLVEPAIDGNSERVIARYLGIGSDPKRGKARQDIAAGARNLLDQKRPGDSNQALMELGATLCRPRRPLCASCPLRADCRARRAGDPEAFPVARAKRPMMKVERQAIVVEDEGRVLLFRRPEASELLAGMWELPWVEHHDQAVRESRLTDRYGGYWSLGRSLGKVRHSITHRRFVVEVFEARLESGQEVAEGEEAGWFAPKDLDNLPISSLVKKVLAVVESGAFAGG